jgi:hypothetical protein
MVLQLINWYIHQHDICGDYMSPAGYYVFQRYPIVSVTDNLVKVLSKTADSVLLTTRHDSHWKSLDLQTKLDKFRES